jgi:hypothetical protein
MYREGRDTRGRIRSRPLATTGSVELSIAVLLPVRAYGKKIPEERI